MEPAEPIPSTFLLAKRLWLLFLPGGCFCPSQALQCISTLMSCTRHLSLGIERYGWESQGRLGTCSGVDFPEGAGGKAAANFHSDVSSKAAGIVKPFSFWRSLGEREGQGRRTCEESLDQGNSRIIRVTQTRSVLFILSQFGSNYKICSFHLVLERSHQQ